MPVGRRSNWEALEFEIPPLEQTQASWRRAVDTYLDPPGDISRWADGRVVPGSTCLVQPRSIVLLAAKSLKERALISDDYIGGNRKSPCILHRAVFDLIGGPTGVNQGTGLLQFAALRD